MVDRAWNRVRYWRDAYVGAGRIISMPSEIKELLQPPNSITTAVLPALQNNNPSFDASLENNNPSFENIEASLSASLTTAFQPKNRIRIWSALPPPNGDIATLANRIRTKTNPH